MKNYNLKEPKGIALNKWIVLQIKECTSKLGCAHQIKDAADLIDSTPRKSLRIERKKCLHISEHPEGPGEVCPWATAWSS